MNVSDAIRLKRAVRKFQDKPLPEDVIQAILNAGRRSQSSKNEQTWQFIARVLGQYPGLSGPTGRRQSVGSPRAGA